MATVNLTPKFKIPIAEKELMLEASQVPMGFQQGGLNMYSNKFKRGYGDAVFGSDENGIWLGLAEYANAPFRVSMDGALAAKSATFIDENDTTIVDAKGLVSTANFSVGSASASPITSFTTSSYVTVSGSPLSIVVSRTVRVLILLTIQMSGEQTAAGSDATGRVFFTPHLNNVALTPEVLIDCFLDNESYASENIIRKTYSTSLITFVSAGTNSLDFRYKIDSGSNLTAILNTWSLTYIILGT